MRRRLDRKLVSLLKSFRYAFHGVWYFLSTQRNAQIHMLVAACALALAAVLGLARWEWLALVLMITLVLAAEAMNTAIEAAVDVATSTYDPLARVAKDVAAGAVLLCAIAAVIVGCLIFLPHLWPVLQNLRFVFW
jgi:diacylglycerol kinase (ATP)